MSEGNGFDRTLVDAIKRGVDLITVVEESGVKLKRTANNAIGLCPFHPDSSSSFSIDLRKTPPLWHCFACGIGGDVIEYVSRREGLTFKQTVHRLKDRLVLAHGHDQPPLLNPEPDHDAPLPGGYTRHTILTRVLELYRPRLSEVPQARDYLGQRGLDSAEVIEAFRIGYCDGHSLVRLLPAQNDLRSALSRIGLLNAQGRELFNGCIVVPLEHPDHGLVGFYGRKIAPNARFSHLYLPGPQRGVVNWQALQSGSEVVIAESPLDAISLWRAGIRHVTSLFSASGLPKDLQELLRRYAVRTVVFCLDGDEAGRQATERLSTMLQSQGVETFAAELPPGQDPNSMLVAHGGEALRQVIERVHVLTRPAEAELTYTLELQDTRFVMQFGAVRYEVTPQGPFNQGRLKANIWARCGDKHTQDTPDLRTHRARTTFAIQIARALSLPRADAERHLMAVLSEAEQWTSRLPLPAETLRRPDPPPMSEVERDQALVFLRDPALIRTILGHMDALGAVGEERAKLICYLVGISRKLKEPLAAIVQSQSGSGKSYVVELVERLSAPEEMELYSRLTAQSLSHMGREAVKHKLLILEERAGGETADYNIRTLLSKGFLKSAVTQKDPVSGNFHTMDIEVEGPIAYLETTTRSDINPENLSRCFLVGIDESIQQTRAIHERQRAMRRRDGLLRRLDADDICQLHHTAQRLLKPYMVETPFAHLITFPDSQTRTRRDHPRFLSLIDTSALLHQYQRETYTLERRDQTVECLKATMDDYRVAWELCRDMLGVALHELSRPAQDLHAELRRMLAQTPDATFTRKDARDFTGWPDYRVRPALQELVSMEYVSALCGSQGATYHYQLVVTDGTQPSNGLLTPDELAARWAAESPKS